MNIDIVNKQVAAKLQIRESQVALINKFYWQKIREHIYSYSNLPINIPSVCVIYPTAYHTKKQLLYYIDRIRKLRVSPRYRIDSIMRADRIEATKLLIRRIWRIRKQNQWTN